MGSNDMVTTFDPGFSSRSYEPMDYTTYNVRYQEDFNISKTRPKYGGKEIRQSMLAYTNYVVERQNRNQHPGHYTRRQNIETDEDTHAQQVSNTSRFPGINLPFSKVPILNKHRYSGPPKVSERCNRFKNEQGILRGNTFPPLNGIQRSKPAKPPVTISVATVSDLYDVTNQTKCEARVSEVINHDKLQAWLSTDQPTAQPDLSSILTTSKPAAIRKQSVVSKSTGSVSFGQGEKHKVFSDNAEAVSTKHGNDLPERIQKNDNDTDIQDFAKKKHSEDLLKSAIKTLKLMEKELEELPKKTKTTKDKEQEEKPKKKKSPKKTKRLQLPEQTLDIIPELECETIYASSPDGGYSSEVSPACVHYSNRSKMGNIVDSMEDTDDGIDHDIDDEDDDDRGAGNEEDAYDRSEEDSLGWQSIHGIKGLTGKAVEFDSRQVLPPINRHNRGGRRITEGLGSSGASKLDKVKSEIRNKIKRRHKHSQ